jgi:ABC-type transport system involved in multi-copper enzyme maturation permease subunit
MFINLFWKEARENLWKLGFCLGVSLAFTVMLLRIRIIPDFAICIVISWAQVFIVPIVYALDIFSGEMSNRTIHLLFKMPTQRWKIFLSKYLLVMLEIGLIFLLTGVSMEILGHAREADTGILLKTNILFGLCAQGLFAWFCVFGCQSRSEAGSLVAMVGVMIGWGIVLLWAVMCEVPWAAHCVPYSFTSWAADMPDLILLMQESGEPLIHPGQLLYSQITMLIIAFAVACYRFVKVRRYL